MPLQVKRLLIAFGAFICFFLVLKYFLKPKSFGELGHYRSLALKENEDKPVKHVGISVCTNCHDTIAKLKAKGLHKTITCESCHGPGYKHVKAYEENIDVKPDAENKMMKPEGRAFCGRCHEKNAARRANVIKQIDLNEHNKDENCVTCHNPHEPWL